MPMPLTPPPLPFGEALSFIPLPPPATPPVVAAALKPRRELNQDSEVGAGVGEGVNAAVGALVGCGVVMQYLEPCTGCSLPAGQ